jgi:hypothetical protein
VSKAAEKSGGPPIRKNAVPAVPSGAGAILHLQRAAGNQAVARMLGSPASGPDRHVPGDVPPAAGPVAPITVQRETLDHLIETAYSKANIEFPGFDNFAQQLITKLNEPARSSAATDAGAKKATGTTGTTGTTTTTTTATTAELTKVKIPTTAELDKQSDMLREQERILTGQGLTAEQKQNLERKQNLDRVQKDLAEKQQLKNQQKELKERRYKLGKKETPEEIEVRMEKERLDLWEERQKLQKQLSPEEISLRNQNEELEVLKEEKKTADEQAALGRKRAMMARRLNPKKKSLSQLAGGRSL